METNNLVKSYASKAAQTALFRSVYLWMTLALVITGFVAMYIAKSYTLIETIMQNSIMFWGLLIAMVVQLIAGIHGPENLAGEWIVFMCLALYLVIDCIKNGIWDRRMKPDFKTNLIASSIAAAVMGVVWFTISYRNYHKLVGSIAAGAFMFLVTGALCCVALLVVSSVYKKRLKKLEEDSTDENVD